MPVGRRDPVAVTVAGLVWLPNEDSEKSDCKLFNYFLPFYRLISAFPRFPSFHFPPPQRHNNQVWLSPLEEQIQIQIQTSSSRQGTALSIAIGWSGVWMGHVTHPNVISLILRSLKSSWTIYNCDVFCQRRRSFNQSIPLLKRIIIFTFTYVIWQHISTVIICIYVNCCT